MKVTLRPLPTWPYPPTEPRRPAQFRSNGRYVDGEWHPGKGRISYDQTLRDLESEIGAIAKTRAEVEVTIGIGLTEHDVRQDGSPRANARPVGHPGVEISFESRYGRLTYATDVFDDWRDNVRAVAKGLEALRAIDRWGVAKRGQQYAGFAQITAGGPDPAKGKALVERAGGIRQALMLHHPDHGGQARDLADVVAYRESIG
ncbi:MAG TPA: hypothetical protein VIM25_12175 [Candidatus Limnocylindrales bacterium]